jgi:CYTH domain-containing protein
MDKTAKTQLARVFLIEDLPEPLTRASGHVQIFDNYIENTRLRIRSVRIPETGGWMRTLEQRQFVRENDAACWKVSEIDLDESEYAVFERFEGREIRKNRYFHEFDGHSMSFDVYLGRLWGLNEARVEFDAVRSMAEFEPPPMLVYEVTNDPFFFGQNLVDMKFEDVRKHLETVPMFDRPEPIQED